LSHSVQGSMAIKGQKFLAGEDSRFGFPDPEAISRVNIDDIRNWITPALTKGPLEIAVVGDIDEDAVIDAAAAYFGALPEREDFRESDPVDTPEFPKDQELELSVPTRISKGLLVNAYPTTHIWDIHQARRLSVLADIISDRMRIRIRENLGASYAQSAGHSPSRAYPDYGLLTGYAVIDPEEMDAVEQAMAEIGAELHANGATEDELKRALEPTFTRIREQIKTNEYWLHTVLKGAGRHPEQLQWSRTLLEDYTCINVEEINQTARKWLKPEHAAVIRIFPESGDGNKDLPEPEDQ
ncbi:MAG: M16 family metallopeptidase, partial [Desulfosalsimonas sp.]